MAAKKINKPSTPADAAILGDNAVPTPDHVKGPAMPVDGVSTAPRMPVDPADPRGYIGVDAEDLGVKNRPEDVGTFNEQLIPGAGPVEPHTGS